MKLLYFAWLKTKTGMAEEDVALPEDVATVGELLTWLEGRGANFADALSDRGAIRVAVNQSYAKPGDPVGPNDEVALFPPVTGG
ncbi:molybdopterin converting factor subunit 1 [Pelagibius marinus]|uniref:molybdopterin converting factor subunit 1 n=1 Tax=Pelagibius marinus TaxID=2762760 RepID=UPI0018733A03|nr:molybdopterin converting factor subunit 1 [Pelagibius marinus]